MNGIHVRGRWGTGLPRHDRAIPLKAPLLAAGIFYLVLPQPARELNMACHDRILTWIACVLFSSALFSAAVSTVPVLLYPALQPFHVQFLRPTQVIRDHCVSVLCDTLATVPRVVPPGQPAGA